MGGLCAAEIENGRQIGDFNFGSINTKGKIAFIVAGSVFTVAALISLFGYVLLSISFPTQHIDSLFLPAALLAQCSANAVS